ncbi:hypothetical protein G4Y73_03930 [Wenzhouxiangella sp. XN201]|uniref:hypothetical protein n=1 Tax=Wenzhouxiangella sp. XN201 TaxID=2710755 RepID=UPI0013C9E685|nr:hypothetical protein [Wenzhouxiangella sp. XN201]NEZ03296.1 hypothetical protein [Wenzhouxiangella sp. XN201]
MIWVKKPEHEVVSFMQFQTRLKLRRDGVLAITETPRVSTSATAEIKTHALDNPKTVNDTLGYEMGDRL